jgi:hypothetical protein
MGGFSNVGLAGVARFKMKISQKVFIKINFLFVNFCDRNFNTKA